MLIHNRRNNWLISIDIVYYHNGSVINSSTSLGNNLCHYFNTDQSVYLPNSMANSLVAIDRIDYNTCLASQYRRNKACGLRYTHLHTLNSDHFVYGKYLDKLQQSYTPRIYPGWGWGSLHGSLCLLNLISHCNFIPDAISNNEREIM